MANINAIRKASSGIFKDIKASPNVRSVTDTIDELIAAKKPVPQELIAAAEKDGALKTADYARRYNEGGDLKDIALPTKEVTKTNKKPSEQTPQGRGFTKEDDEKYFQDVENKYKQNKNAAIDEARQEAGLSKTATTPEQPKKVKQLTEKGGSPVPTKTAEAPKTKTEVAAPAAEPQPAPTPESKSLTSVKQTFQEDTKKAKKPENVYLPQSQVNEGRLNTTETQGVARGSANVETYNPKTKKWEQTGVANQAETPNLPAVIDKNQINISAKQPKNPDLITTDNYSSTGKADTTTKEAIAKGAITEMSFNYQTGRFEPLRKKEQAGLANPPAVITKPGQGVTVGAPNVEAGPVRRNDGSGLPVPRGETGYTIKEKTQFVDRSQKLLPPARIDQLEDEMIRAKQGGTEALKVFMDKIKEQGIALTAIGSGAAGILLGRSTNQKEQEQAPVEDKFANIKPHVTAQELSEYKDLSSKRDAITAQIEQQQKKLQDAQSKITPNYYTQYNKQAADAKKNIENLSKELTSVTGKLGKIEEGIPESALYPEPIKKMQEKAAVSGDFKTTPAPQADEKSRQITELQRQINDPSKTPEQKKILQSALDRMQGKTPGVEPAPTPAPAPAPTPTKPEAPEQKAKPSGPFGAEKPSDLLNFFEAVREKASPMSELDEATRTRLTTLENTLNDQINTARIIYEETVEKARTEAERRESIMNWARIGEQLAQAATKYFAAREGKRLGARIGSELKFQKHDWAGDLDRSLKKMESELAGAKEKYGIVSKEVEAGREALGKERTRLEDRAVKQADTFIKAALDEREQQREEQSRMRLKAQDLALAQVQNAAKLNQAIQIQQMKMDLSKENLKTKLSTKQNAEIDKVGKSRTESTQLFFALYDAKKDKRGAAAKAFADASADLLLTQEESAQLDNLSKGPNIGRKGLMPTYTSDEENKATAAAILQRAEIRRINQLSGGQFNVVQGAEEGEAPAAQTSGQEGAVLVKFKTGKAAGQTKAYPAAYLQNAEVKKLIDDGAIEVLGQSK